MQESLRQLARRVKHRILVCPCDGRYTDDGVIELMSDACDECRDDVEALKGAGIDLTV